MVSHVVRVAVHGDAAKLQNVLLCGEFPRRTAGAVNEIMHRAVAGGCSREVAAVLHDFGASYDYALAGAATRNDVPALAYVNTLGINNYNIAMESAVAARSAAAFDWLWAEMKHRGLTCAYGVFCHVRPQAVSMNDLMHATGQQLKSTFYGTVHKMYVEAAKAGELHCMRKIANWLARRRKAANDEAAEIGCEAGAADVVMTALDLRGDPMKARMSAVRHGRLDILKQINSKYLPDRRSSLTLLFTCAGRGWDESRPYADMLAYLCDLGHEYWTRGCLEGKIRANGGWVVDIAMLSGPDAAVLDACAIATARGQLAAVRVLQQRVATRETQPAPLMEAIVAGHKQVVAEVLAWVDDPARYLTHDVVVALAEHDCCEVVYPIEDKLPPAVLADLYITAAEWLRGETMGRLLRETGALAKYCRSVCDACVALGQPCEHPVAAPRSMADRALATAVDADRVDIVDIILRHTDVEPAHALTSAVMRGAPNVVAHLLEKSQLSLAALYDALELADRCVASAVASGEHPGGAKFIHGLLKAWLQELTVPLEMLVTPPLVCRVDLLADLGGAGVPFV
jgi:hypothetical protein